MQDRTVAALSRFRGTVSVTSLFSLHNFLFDLKNALVKTDFHHWNEVTEGN